MKPLDHLDHLRDRAWEARGASPGDHTHGCFVLRHPATGADLMVIASNDRGWDHVSVSIATRCPTWEEMEHVKRTFFHDWETAMQLHVPVDDHVSVHPFALHLWRPRSSRKIPRPPARLVL